MVAEQSDLLQGKLYSSTDAQIAGSLGLFNDLAQGNFYDRQGGLLLSFEEYSEALGLEPDLSVFHSRISWMNYLILSDYK